MPEKEKDKKLLKELEDTQAQIFQELIDQGLELADAAAAIWG
jgi:hypothetical protein